MSSNSLLFKKEILYNSAFPLDKHFTTCISLSRKTYEEIDEISSITKISKRSNVIERAIEHYVNSLRNEQQNSISAKGNRNE
ncbi:MAG: hypothetical protein ACI4GX_08950 [Ruminococcus sp.]